MKLNYLSLCSRGSANPGFILISGQCILAILLLASVYSISMPKKWKKKIKKLSWYGFPLQWAAIHGHTWPCMAMHGHVRPYPLNGPVRQKQQDLESIWLSTNKSMRRVYKLGKSCVSILLPMQVSSGLIYPSCLSYKRPPLPHQPNLYLEPKWLR